MGDDGALHVHEERTFVYDGTFRGAFYTLPLRDGQAVTGFTLRDSTGVSYEGVTGDDERPGTYVLEQSGDEFSVTWFYGEPATDESRTYELDYTVTGAGTRHADASQLYWQWIGTGWDVATDRVVADLTLPSTAAALTAGEDLLVWGHGPLTGTVEVVDAGVVRTEVTGLAPNTFVELRVLMPTAVLGAAASDGQEVRAEILEEEGCLAVAADADRAEARGEEPAEDCDPRAGLARVGNGVLAAGLVGAGAAWTLLFRRYGREHVLPRGLADYERELPSDDPPALVAFLLGWGSLGDDALVATIMELARRGKIGLSREQVTRDGFFRDRTTDVLVMRRLATAEEDWERSVQTLLFAKAGDGRQVTDAELKEWVKDHRDEAYRWWQSWVSELEAAGRSRSWIEPKGWMVASVAFGVALIAVAVAAAVALRAALPLALLAGAAGLAMLAATPLLRRRTPAGRVLHHRWSRFGKFLTDFSMMPDRTPEMLPLWGRYLVYAVPLGVADTVMGNLDANLSEAELQRAGGGWYS